MKDLKRALELNRQNYEKFSMRMPKLKAMHTTGRLVIAQDMDDNIAQATKTPQCHNDDELCEYAKKNVGRPLDECVTMPVDSGDAGYRSFALALLNLMSKPLESEELLESRGIRRRDGMHFRYGLTDRKVALVGYGRYVGFFLGKPCSLHIFDRRPNETIADILVASHSFIGLENIKWYLDTDAAAHPDVLGDMDYVIMSGSAIADGSYIEILKACKDAAVRGVYGPNAQLCPDFLFEAGFNYISVSTIMEAERYLRDVRAFLPYFADSDYMDTFELTK